MILKTGIHICELDYDPRTGRFINEDPAFDGDNWYTYCGSNPINSFDPSGLVSIRNTYLSDKYPNFPNGTGGTNALRITIKRNTVKILWNCYFTGDNVDKKVMKSTYREIITSAIEKKWSGTFKVKGIKNVKVKTKVWDKSNGKDHIYETGQKWSKITFHREVGVSNVSGTGKFLWWGGWKRNKLGNMNLYIGDKRDGSDHRYSKNQLQIIAAHEFGHILGIKDGYNSAKTESINSIMCDQWGDLNKIALSKRKATGKDITKALNAYKSNKAQSW